MSAGTVFRITAVTGKERLIEYFTSVEELLNWIEVEGPFVQSIRLRTL